jgi:hypothetical protein
MDEIKRDVFISEEDAIAKSDTWLTQKVFNEIREEVYQRGTFTVYIIHAVAKGSEENKMGKEYEGVGFAKARPDITVSQYDAEKGKEVARGRAIHDLFQEYRKNGRKEG